MKKIAFLLAFAALFTAFPVFGVEIVPKPVSLSETGGRITISNNISFCVLQDELAPLVPTWSAIYGPLASDVSTAGQDGATVLLDLDGALGPEEYRLTVGADPDRITVCGGGADGVWWGLQTLAQLLIQGASDDGFDLPCLEISDRPAFSYRAGMLDCGRHFFPTESIKRFIDILAMHKLNVFHWSLTNDQGWRIEIRKYPLLTEVGSVRRETMVGLLSNPKGFDGIPHGGFYSQEEIRDIVKYAEQRHVTVIPEIEMPGHATAALASYPELGCRGEGYEVSTSWGVKEDIFCVGKPGTIPFLEDVLDEVCELFPSRYIHIGGDEAPTARWEECPACQAKMKELGLEKAAYLHGYLLKTIEEHLNAKGRRIIGWDEILDAGVTPTATVMSWRGAEGGKRAALQGNDVIMSPNIYLYFDFYQTEDPASKGERTSGYYLPLSKAYSFDPYEDLNDEASRSHIIGIQGQVWTEYIADFDHVQLMFVPRCCALSEDAWNLEKEDAAAFALRVKDVMIPLYEALGVKYADYALDE